MGNNLNKLIQIQNFEIFPLSPSKFPLYCEIYTVGIKKSAISIEIVSSLISELKTTSKACQQSQIRKNTKNIVYVGTLKKQKNLYRYFTIINDLVKILYQLPKMNLFSNNILGHKVIFQHKNLEYGLNHLLLWWEKNSAYVLTEVCHQESK